MEVRIEKPKSYIREMHISIPYERYAKEKERITKSYQSAAEIPGFRRGKAPIGMVATSFKSQIEKEAREDIIRDVFAKAVREHHLFPITHAEIRDFAASEEHGHVTFSARFQVIPDFELSLDGLGTTFTPAPVAEGTISEALRDLQDKYTTAKPVSIPARAGDTVEFDYVACDAEGLEVDSAQGMVVTCAQGEEEELLASKLLGVTAGEERELDIPYPPTFPVMELHGTAVRLQMQIREVKERIVPGIDDEFAKTVGLASVGELRSSIRKQLEDEQEMIAYAEARDRMVETLLLHNEFDVPEALLAYYQEQQRGSVLTPDEQEKLHAYAEKKAKLNIILDKVAAEKALKIPEEDIDAFIKGEAARESVDPQKLRTYLVQTGRMEDIITMFKREKAFRELERQFIKKG
jgi:trigger factor